MLDPLFFSNRIFLGIPLDTLNSEEFLKKIEAQKIHGEKLAAAILSQPIINELLSWKGDKFLHPEVIHSLRKLDDVFLNGMDFAVLFNNWSETGKRVVLAGKNEVSLEHFKDRWLKKYPALQLEVYPAELSFEGKALEEIRQEDAIFFHDVMKKKPDILLLDVSRFDLPSIVERLSSKSDIPLVIGFDGEQDKMTWLDFLKFNYLNTVANFKSHIERWRSSFLPKGIEKPQYLFFGQEQIIPNMSQTLDFRPSQSPGVGQSEQPPTSNTGDQITPTADASLRLKNQSLRHVGHCFAVLKFPAYFFGESVEQFVKRHDFALNYKIEVFDVSDVKFMDGMALSLLMTLFKSRLKNRNQVFLIGVSSSLKIAMIKYRVYDYFLPFIYTKKEQLVKALEMLNIPFLWSFVYKDNRTIVYFFGQLDVRQDQTYAFENISAKLLGDTIIFNFEWCYYIDSSGLGFLLRLRKWILQLKKNLILCGLNDYIAQTLKLTKVDRLFDIVKNCTSLYEG